MSDLAVPRCGIGAALVCLLAACDPAPPAPGSDFDASGLAPFWAVHDELAQDREPSAAQWDSMWATPGYALLQARERRRPALSAAMRLAYRPSLRPDADTATGWTRYVLPHLRQVPAARDSVADLLATIARERWLDSARSLAQRYLPAGLVDRSPPGELSLIYFIDARGYPERLLLDPLHFLQLPNPVEVLAHEFHHHYRAEVEQYGDFGDDLLAWVLSTTEGEGIAGLLDKAAIPAMTPEELARRIADSTRRDYFLRYQVEYGRPEVRLRQADDVLTRVGAHPDSAAVLGRWLHGELPDNGRILGAFMAAAVERVLGRERLVEVVGRPFEFWRVYGEAARQDPDLPAGLSEAALAVLDGIDRRYRAASP